MTRMSIPQYDELKDDVIIAVGSIPRTRNILSSMKEIFKEKINSVRRFEEIKSVGELLKVLEYRGHLDEENVESLKEIAREIGSSDLLRKIKLYEGSNLTRESCLPSEYADCNTSEKQNGSSINNNVLGGISLKKEKIYKIVTDKIGTNWRNLARNLKMRECDIDHIDFNYKSLKTKSLKVMDKFENEKANPQTWYFVLCDALENIPRKDIVRDIKEETYMPFNIS